VPDDVPECFWNGFVGFGDVTNPHAQGKSHFDAFGNAGTRLGFDNDPVNHDFDFVE